MIVYSTRTSYSSRIPAIIVRRLSVGERSCDSQFQKEFFELSVSTDCTYRVCSLCGVGAVPSARTIKQAK